MRIHVDNSTAAHEAAFLDRAAEALAAGGHTIVRDGRQPLDGAIVWNGREWRLRGRHRRVPTVYVECGWLPRWHYQVSWRGINADHHACPLPVHAYATAYDQAGAPRVRESAMAPNPYNWRHSRTDSQPPANLPERFWLAPLQIPTDTNMGHVPEPCRDPSGFVDTVQSLALDAPVVFKHHPATSRLPDLPNLAPGNTVIDAMATVYSLLASGRVRGVVSANSNTLNDALLYGVPGIALGHGIWPPETGPMYCPAPGGFDAADFALWETSANRTRATCGYLNDIDGIQWTAEDARDVTHLLRLLEHARDAMPTLQPRPHTDTPLINVVAGNRGWLFEDLKQHLEDAADTAGCDVAATDTAIPNADAYLYMRPEDARQTPDFAVTTVQVHDFYLGNRAGRLSDCADCAGWQIVHPGQLRMIRDAVKAWPPRVMCRPLGAPTRFTTRVNYDHDAFRVAWVGRASHMKRVPLFVEAVTAAAASIPNLEVIMLGANVEQFAPAFEHAGVKCECIRKATYRPSDEDAEQSEREVIGVMCECDPRGGVYYTAYPALYRAFDVVVITSDTETQPFPLFEAMASGVPVISTLVGWAPRLIVSGVNGYLVMGHDGIVKALRTVWSDRELFFNARHLIADTVRPYTLEGWCEDSLRLATHNAGWETAT